MDDFEEVIKEATRGELWAIERVILQYRPLINKYSMWQGRIDEDLRQYIELRIFRKISKFNV